MFSRIKKRGAVFGLLFAFALIASACADEEPATTTTQAGDTTTTEATTTTAATTTTGGETTTTLPPPPEGAEVKACQVSDTGGIDDKSFNETAWNGMLRAEAELEGVTEVKFLESQSTADFRPNIDSFISEGCDLIVTVGFLLADDTAAAATENPDQRFAIIDFPSVALDPAPPGNVRGINFQTDEAAFLAGYLAAGMTETEVVATYGGINIPPVTIFMNGFYWGVQHYNEQNDASVEVLGWDPANPEGGSFTGDFENTDNGRSFAESFMDEGADIILPVAGPVGLGTAAAVQTRGNAWIIGVDSDWTQSSPEFADVVLTSILKRMDVAVYNTINNVLVLDSLGNEYNGTLDNDGVSLGTTAAAVPQELLDEVETVKQGIIADTISVTGPPPADG